jgi:hypothetical protein
MEHSYIEKHDIVGRYLSGRLSDEELIRFEEHFLNCQQCVDQVETTEDIRCGLRTAAAEEAWLSKVHIHAGFLAWIVRLRRARRAIFLAIAVLLIAPIAWLAWMWNSARRELIEARQTSLAWQRSYEQNAQAARDLAREMQTQERQISDERDRLAAQLKSEREAWARPPHPLNRVREGVTVVPVFTLSGVRDISPDLSEPIDEIRLSPVSKSIILLLELEADPDLQSYRAAVSTADGRNIWIRDDLRPKSKDGLALSFNSNLFKPDTYLLTLEGLTTERRYKLIAKYTFRVLSRQVGANM